MVIVIKDKKVPMSCCGQKLTEIIPGTTDAAVEKHVPAFEVKDGKVCVKVGEVAHPMVEAHYIEWVLVQTDKGLVSGVYSKDGKVEIYAGIPYAKPPVGELRWRAPQDPEPWSGVLACDAFAPMSMQVTNLPIYDSWCASSAIMISKYP